jgi:hypothetical protein
MVIDLNHRGCCGGAVDKLADPKIGRKHNQSVLIITKRTVFFAFEYGDEVEEKF